MPQSQPSLGNCSINGLETAQHFTPSPVSWRHFQTHASLLRLLHNVWISGRLLVNCAAKAMLGDKPCQTYKYLLVCSHTFSGISHPGGKKHKKSFFSKIKLLSYSLQSILKINLLLSVIIYKTIQLHIQQYQYLYMYIW